MRDATPKLMPSEIKAMRQSTARVWIFAETQALLAGLAEFSNEIGHAPLEVIDDLVHATIGRKVGPTYRVQCALGSRDHWAGVTQALSAR